MELRHLVGAVGTAAIFTGCCAAQVSQVPYASLTQHLLWDFSGVSGAGPQGTNYDGIVSVPGVSFAERFVGQTLSYVPSPAGPPAGDHDALSPTATGPLALQVGLPGQNFNVIGTGSTRIIDGLGPAGFPSPDATGEGALSALFNVDQSEIGLDVLTQSLLAVSFLTINFFKRDGSLIQTLQVQVSPGDPISFRVGLRRDGGLSDIAGLSITNDDPGGVGFNVPAPAPSTFVVLGGMGALLAGRRRR